MQQSQHRHWKDGLALLFILGTAPGARSTVTSYCAVAELPDANCMQAVNNGNLDLEKCTGPSDFTCNLVFADLTGVDLSKRNFKGCNMTCADLTGVTLDESDMTDAILDGACLNGATLIKVSGQRISLRNVTAMGADFSEADISGEQEAAANFVGGMFQGSNFFKTNLKAADLTDADFSAKEDSGGGAPTPTSFMEASLESITGSNVNFTDAIFTMASLTDFDCMDCIFDGVDMSFLGITDGNLTGASFVSANLAGVSFEDLELNDVDFSNADLRNAIIKDMRPIGAQLSGADLTGCQMEDVNMTGANLTGTILRNAQLSDVEFVMVDADGADFTGTALDGSDFSYSNLTGTLWTDAVLDKTNFADSNMSGSSFSQAQGVETSFCGADLTEADFTNSVFTKGFFGTQCGPPGGELELVTTLGRGANVTGADFSGADVWESDFQGTEGFPLASFLVAGTRFDMNPEKRQNFNDPLPSDVYEFIGDELEWAEALERCQRLGLTLAYAPDVSPDPDPVEAFLTAQGSSGRSAWIGLRRPAPDSAVDHQWIMGFTLFSERSETDTADRWAGVQPGPQPKDNVHCAFMSKNDNYDWKSKGCTDKLRAVCGPLPPLV